MKNDQLFYAYLAGFVDADGLIGIVSLAKEKRYVIQVSACNCNETPIQMLKEKFGGKIRKRIWKNKKWKPNYEWKLTSLKAKAVIQELLPYLKIKHEQAKLALEAQELKSEFSCAYWRWNPEVKKKRDSKLLQLKQKCNKLNKRGTND